MQGDGAAGPSPIAFDGGGEGFEDEVIEGAEGGGAGGFAPAREMRRGPADEEEGVGDDDVPGERDGERDDAEERAEAVGVVVGTEGETGEGAEGFDCEGAEEDGEAPASRDGGCPLAGGVEVGVGEGEEDEDGVAGLEAEADEAGERVREGPAGDVEGGDVAEGEGEAAGGPEEEGGEEDFFPAGPDFHAGFGDRDTAPSRRRGVAEGWPPTASRRRLRWGIPN